MSINDRGRRTKTSRRATTAAGIATIVFSLLVSIGPAIGAQGGNAGTVKIHDATSGLEANGNDPWVCEFWVGFYTTDSAETGTWQILSWEPTGDGSVVESGSYDTGDDGVDSTATLALAEGHFRLEWQADDANTKHKTFWVDCEDVESNGDPSASAEASSTEDESSPSEAESTPSDESSPSEEESTPSDEESTPSDESSPSEEESTPSQEPSPSEEGSTASDESSPSEDANPSEEETVPSDEETVPSDEETVPSDDESTPSDDESTPSDDESTPSDEEVANPTDDELADPGASGQEPEGDVKAGNPGSGGGATHLPDTAIPVTQSGVLATIGVLLIIAAHAGTRRERQLPSA